MTTETATALAAWQADEARDANGYTSIRVADGSPHGNTEIGVIATVYCDAAVPLIAHVPALLKTLKCVEGFLRAWAATEREKTKTDAINRSDAFYEEADFIHEAIDKAEGR